MRDVKTDAILAGSLSRERLEKYLAASGGDLGQALTLYERNTRLSEAFYTPLQALEISFRNKLNERMVAFYGSGWYRPGQAPLHADAQDNVTKALQTLRFSRKPVTTGALVAELSFDFWVGLLGPRYDATLWRRTLYLAFLDNGQRMKRDRAHGRFNMLRRFRNRIAHHEPIFQNAPNSIHAEIIEAIVWLCPTTALWAARHSRFPAVFAAP